MILLDTHILIWIVEDSDMLAAEVRDEIAAAAGREEVLASPMSIWEIAMLVSKRRIKLSLPLHDWANVIFERERVGLAALTPKVAIECWRLAPGLNADPVDRLLVATARSLDATLMTRDHDILRYGAQGQVKVRSA